MRQQGSTLRAIGSVSPHSPFLFALALARASRYILILVKRSLVRWSYIVFRWCLVGSVAVVGYRGAVIYTHPFFNLVSRRLRLFISLSQGDGWNVAQSKHEESAEQEAK